jgi:ATP-dependent RNA helicase DDX49/DBP8
MNIRKRRSSKHVQILAGRKRNSETKCKKTTETDPIMQVTDTAFRAIWKGYREIKEAAGWAALVFAGFGVYRFCKYRVGFDTAAIARLSMVGPRFEVAADMLHPQWRELLYFVDTATPRRYTGHPHDWVVHRRGGDQVSLASTYHRWDPHFAFEHLRESTIDESVWRDCDPRQVSSGPTHTCKVCKQIQSALLEYNQCQCFPSLYGANARRSYPVQVFQTEDGRNNGLTACCVSPRRNSYTVLTLVFARNLRVEHRLGNSWA